MPLALYLKLTVSDKVSIMFFYFLDLEALFYVPPYQWLENASVPWYYIKVPSDGGQNSNGRTPGYYNFVFRYTYRGRLDIPESASGEFPLVSALYLALVRCSGDLSCPNAARRQFRSVACVVCTKWGKMQSNFSGIKIGTLQALYTKKTKLKFEFISPHASSAVSEKNCNKNFIWHQHIFDV